MLDPWIIEEIRRREEEERRDERPVLEIPQDAPICPPEREGREDGDRDEDDKRGVVIVDFRV